MELKLPGSGKQATRDTNETDDDNISLISSDSMSPLLNWELSTRNNMIASSMHTVTLAEEDGYDWGGTMGGEQVHYNRDLLKRNHSRGGTCPWCPPGSATYV